MRGGSIPDLVGRVVVRSSADTPGVRVEARQRVGRLRLRPRGAAPREILVVRSLVDRAEPGPGGSLGEQLDEARRSAVPLDGRPVPSGARSVLAADLAQLLSQYAADLHDGALATRWWWRVLGARFTPAPVATLLAQHPLESPHVVADLVARRRTDVLDGADAAEVRRLLLVMAEAYRAPRLAEVCSELDPHRLPAAPPSVDAGAAATQAATTPAELLVLVASHLATDPVGTRGPDFARFVGVVAGLQTVVERPRADRPEEGPEPGRVAEPDAAPPTGPVADSGPARRGGAETVGVSSLDSEPWTPDAGERSPARDGVGAPAEVFSPRPTATGQGDGPSEVGAPGVDQPPELLGVAAEQVTTSGGAVTDLGGVFFLIGLVQELGLPEVCEPDWQLASRLGGWGALDLLARVLVTDEEAAAHDPVWEALADLGGGPPLVRAAGLTGPVRGLRPTEWQHLPAVPGRELPGLARTLAAPARGAVRRWLLLTRPVVAGVLAERIDVAARDLPAAVLRRPARLSWDRAHLDVAFPLAAASVAVRRAGLDRDPGWMPSLARVVAFHFDDDLYEGAEA